MVTGVDGPDAQAGQQCGAQGEQYQQGRVPRHQCVQAGQVDHTDEEQYQ